MASNEYIEINSTYRNRSLFPLAAEFELPLETSGINGTKDSAEDPVCISAPLFAWSSNRLNAYTASSNTLTLTPIIPSVGSALGALTTNVTILEEAGSSVQQLTNYYAGLVIDNNTDFFLRRIDAEKYYGQTSGGDDMILVGMVNPMPDVSLTTTTAGVITDPTDFSNTSYPFLFVPNGSNYSKAYNQYLIYNETLNQYRPVANYNEISHVLQIDTSGSTTFSSGAIVGWSETDNFSLRRAPPLIPPLGLTGSNVPTIQTTMTDTDGITYDTTLSLIVVIDAAGCLSSIVNAYRNDYLRVLPCSFSPVDRGYDYTPTPSINQCRRIAAYKQVEDVFGVHYGIFTLETALDTIVGDHLCSGVNGATIEVLEFSYNNYSPLSYNGSLVSQQEAVCYEIQLHSITLPNAQISVSNGGRLVNYPFIYVQLSNVSNTTGTFQTIYSNNPNAWSALFRCAIFDINVPSITPFVRIDGSGMVVNVKFKPNDCLYMRVFLPDGTTFATSLIERFAPYSPNVFSQISALFRIKRI